eukprot:c13847_g1_i1 orf=82-369(+)
MLGFPRLVPPTVEHHAYWPLLHNEEALLAQEEAEFELKMSEIRTANETLIPIGQTVAENDQDEYERDVDDDDADNVDDDETDNVEGEEFEQDTVL